MPLASLESVVTNRASEAVSSRAQKWLRDLEHADLTGSNRAIHFLSVPIQGEVEAHKKGIAHRKE
jgi:hypothetical protein